MSLTLILARHAESVWHDENRYAGRSDIELSHNGHRQAAALAAWASTAHLDAVWTSSLQRALDTARVVSTVSDAALYVDTRLAELDFGIAEGLTADELDDKSPGDLQAFRVDPVEGHFPGGEDPTRAVHRYLAVIDEITARHATGRVLVVAHNTMIRLTLCSLLGLGLHRYRSAFPTLGNCALTELILSEDQVGLIRYNCQVST